MLVLITFCFFVFDCYFDLDLWFAGFDWLFGVGCVWVGGLVVFVCIACGCFDLMCCLGLDLVWVRFLVWVLYFCFVCVVAYWLVVFMI